MTGNGIGSGMTTSVLTMPQVPPELEDNADRRRWNERYGSRPASAFTPHELAVLALSARPPDGPMLELACGPSGSALLAAERGRSVTAVDVSEVALGQLMAEAQRRHVDRLISVVQADLTGWQPSPRPYALVVCTGYWDSAVFAAGVGSVTRGGLIAWEALTQAARRAHPQLPAEWCLAPGEPACLLPPGFDVVSQHDVGPEPGVRRRLLARRTG
jgi:SAM-dependent methyltransferase